MNDFIVKYPPNNDFEIVTTQDVAVLPVAPTPVDALIAALNMLDGTPMSKQVMTESAAALAAQQARIADEEAQHRRTAKLMTEQVTRAERAEARVAELEQSNEVLRSLYDAKIPIHERRRLPNAVWDERDDPLTASFWPDCTCVECYALHEMAVARAALRQAVPREPTRAMIEAGVAHRPTWETWPAGVWRAMYDAAQPGGEKEG